MNVMYMYVLSFRTCFQNDFLYMINTYIQCKNGNTQVICIKKTFKAKTFGVLKKYIDVKRSFCSIESHWTGQNEEVVFLISSICERCKNIRYSHIQWVVNIHTHITVIHKDLQMSFPVIWSDVCMVCVVLPYWPLTIPIPIRWTALILLIDSLLSNQ